MNTLPHLRPESSPLLSVEHVVVSFPVGRRRLQAVSDVSLDVLAGETLGLVGESGCGKSTLARAVMQLPRPSAGTMTFEGTELTKLAGAELRAIRPRMQMVFQDPVSSLNPRRKISRIVAEPLVIHGVGDASQRERKVAEILDAVGLEQGAFGDRKPFELSGGQCQRVSIARALVLEPALLICDEPVSALDVSVQAQILNLLEDLKDRYGLTMLFIAHDLPVVKAISDRVAVMYLGKLCEIAPAHLLQRQAAHHYTAALIAAAPRADPTQRTDAHAITRTEPPSPLSPPSGCRYRTRCPRAQELCATQEPQMREVAPEQYVACHFPIEA